MPPTRANATKRTGTMPPTSLSSSSMQYSQTAWLSSLLSPAVRSRNWYGSSTKRGGCAAEAKRSSRILKPIPESARTRSANASRRIMKKPLIGSVRSAWSTRWLSRVAKRLIRARDADQSPSPPGAR